MEGPAQKVILQKFQSMGLDIEEFVPDLDALKNHPEFLPPTQEYGNYEDRPNVVGTLKGTGEGQSLLLFGHIDTVPEGPTENLMSFENHPVESQRDRSRRQR